MTHSFQSTVTRCIPDHSGPPRDSASPSSSSSSTHTRPPSIAAGYSKVFRQVAGLFKFHRQLSNLAGSPEAGAGADRACRLFESSPNSSRSSLLSTRPSRSSARSLRFGSDFPGALQGTTGVSKLKFRLRLPRASAAARRSSRATPSATSLRLCCNEPRPLRLRHSRNYIWNPCTPS